MFGFFFALRVPTSFRRLFAEGAFSQAFVPVMVEYQSKGLQALRGFLASLSGLFGLTLLLIVLLGVLFADSLTWVFAPGFDADKLATTAELVRITFPYLGFIAMAAYAGALLNAHQHFLLPAVSPVFLNLCLIGGATLVVTNVNLGIDTSKGGIVVLAWAVASAGVIQLAILVPSLSKRKLLVKPNFNYKDAGVRKVGKLLGPAIFSASVAQINALVNTILASTLLTGSISWIYYADRLMELPLGVVAVALGTMMLPHLSRLAQANNKVDFAATLEWGVFMGLLIGLPAAGALFFLSEPISAAVYMAVGGGAMNSLDITMIGLALEFFAIALPGFVLVKVLQPGFFAHQNTHTPFVYAGIAVVVNIVVSLATFTWFGHVGLALATAASAWTQVVLLLFGLRRAGHFEFSSHLLGQLLRILCASILICLLLYWLVVPLPWMAWVGWLRLSYMLAIITLTLLAFCAILWVLGIRLRQLRLVTLSA